MKRVRDCDVLDIAPRRGKAAQPRNLGDLGTVSCSDHTAYIKLMLLILANVEMGSGGPCAPALADDDVPGIRNLGSTYVLHCGRHVGSSAGGWGQIPIQYISLLSEPVSY